MSAKANGVVTAVARNKNRYPQRLDEHHPCLFAPMITGQAGRSCPLGSMGILSAIKNGLSHRVMSVKSALFRGQPNASE
jgi:hypothetical protein